MSVCPNSDQPVFDEAGRAICPDCGHRVRAVLYPEAIAVGFQGGGWRFEPHDISSEAGV